jgi:hypothetical protein
MSILSSNPSRPNLGRVIALFILNMYPRFVTRLYLLVRSEGKFAFMLTAVSDLHQNLFVRSRRKFAFMFRGDCCFKLNIRGANICGESSF